MTGIVFHSLRKKITKSRYIDDTIADGTLKYRSGISRCLARVYLVFGLILLIVNFIE